MSNQVDNAKDQSTIASMNAEFLSHTCDTAIVSGTVCSLYASLVEFWNDFFTELFDTLCISSIPEKKTVERI